MTATTKVAIAMLIAFAFGLLTSYDTVAAVSGRWYGANRFETAAAVARNSYPAGAEVVYLASHDAFADPMVAGQAIPVGPILLAGTEPLHPATCQALNDLEPTTIIVIGGTSSVPEANVSDAEACVEG